MNRRSFPHEAVGAIFQVVGEGNSHSEVCDLTAPTHPETVSVDACHCVTVARLSAGLLGLCRPCEDVSPLSRN